MNSNAKGKVGERELAKELRAYGYEAKRGQQFCGVEGNHDVIGLPKLAIECKRVEKLNIDLAYEQCVSDSKDGEIPVVMHRKNGKKWKVTMSLDDFISFYREWI